VVARRFEFEEQLLEPQLVDLVDDDEEELVVRRRVAQGTLCVENALEI
jgi:hypothetical protein